jgi:DNA replication protein DnaC
MDEVTKRLQEQLGQIHLDYLRENYELLAREAAEKQWTHVDYLARLFDGQIQAIRQRAVQRRVAAARFPNLKTLEDFQWHWPKKINRPQVQNLFRLGFVPEKANVIFLGGVGLGKTHLATALGYTACQRGYSVRFTTAVDIINTLTTAQINHRLSQETQKLVTPQVLCIDELGYLPIDKTGADLLFQVISERYEKGSIILTSNQPYKGWPKIFNGDATLASAVLDRLLHHAETVVIEGKSYRMKDQIESPA